MNISDLVVWQIMNKEERPRFIITADHSWRDEIEKSLQKDEKIVRSDFLKSWFYNFEVTQMGIKIEK